MGKDFCVKGIYNSGMVLQRDKINCIYGSGDVFSDVIMSFRGVTSITQVDENGEWKFEFSPGEAGGPFNMIIKSDCNKVEFSDIYVGEVWLNAGEGNSGLPMELLKYSYEEEFLLPENPNVRMINVPANYSFSHKVDFVANPKWESVSPSSICHMPGISYFFGKKLSVDLGVPVGIINISAENVPIASWISKKGLEEMGDKGDLDTISYYEVAENVVKSEGKEAELEKWNSELAKSLPEIDFSSEAGWSSCSIPGDISELDSNGIIWLKKVVELSQNQISHFKKNGAFLWLGVISCTEEVFLNGHRVGATSNVNRPRRFNVDPSFFVAGKNTILIKVLKTDKIIKFIREKPYCLFSGDFNVASSVVRNVEKKDISLAPIDGEYFSLEGEWLVKVGAITGDAPELDYLLAKPSAIYNGVLPACFKYAIAGVIWYQGESDVLAGRAGEYKGLLTKLINVWRRRFTYWSRDLPFVIVQLPNWACNGAEGDISVCSELAILRKAQCDVSEIVDKVGLVVSIDAGEWNDMYPEKKNTIGTRCEFEALRVAYGKSYISAAPKANFCEFSKDKITVKFDCGNSSLHACFIDGFSGDLTKEQDEGKVAGFSLLCVVNGENKIFPADAKLVGSNVVEVYIPQECKNMELTEIRYLWGDCPAPVNLYSRDMIPAGPFVIKTK